MSDKQAATPTEVLAPKSKRGEAITEVELWIQAQAKADQHKAGVVGDFQRRLEAMATERKLLIEKGLNMDWADPTWNQALSDLGLFNVAPAVKGKAKKANVEKDWSDTKAGKLIMEKYSKGDTFGVDDIMKKFDLSKSTATQYLSKGSSSGYLESMGSGKYKRIK